LEKIGEIEESSLEAVSEDQTKAIIKTGEDVDIREPLFYLLAEEKLPLLDMHISTKSLEDIFLELTDSEKLNAANDEEEEVHTKKGIHLSRKKEEKKREQEETDNESNL
jgi:ABC-2 type transport system ATP-binding protein